MTTFISAALGIPAAEKPHDFGTDPESLRRAGLQNDTIGEVRHGFHFANADRGRDQAREEKKKEQDIERYIRLQLLTLHADIALLEKEYAAYGAKLATLGVQMALIENAIAANVATRDVLAQYAEKGLSRHHMLKGHYGDKVFTDAPGNIWDALNNPLTDSQGRMVYSDRNGNLYTLNFDPRSNELQRVYYDIETDYQEITDLMAQAYGPEKKLFANETFKGRDLTNHTVHEWIHVQSNLPGMMQEKIDPAAYALTVKTPDGKTSLSQPATIAGALAVCEGAHCQLIEEGENLAAEQKKTQEAQDKVAETLTEKYNERSALQGKVGAAESDASDVQKEIEEKNKTDKANTTPAPKPDQAQATITAHKNGIAQRIALTGGRIDPNALKLLAAEYGIPEAYIPQLTATLEKYGDIKIVPLPDMQFSAAQKYFGPVQLAGAPLMAAHFGQAAILPPALREQLLENNLDNTLKPGLTPQQAMA